MSAALRGVGMSAPLALVTGGAGFIGGHLVESLVADGWRVRVLDDFSTGREANLAAVVDAVDVRRGDVRDAAVAARAAAGVDVLFHHAAIASVPRSVAEPHRTHEVNVLGTLRMLEAAHAAGVRRFVQASSTSASVETPDLAQIESAMEQAPSPYALQKQTAEAYCRLFGRLHGLDAVALRYFNVYGPRQDPEGEHAAVIPRFVRACLDGARPTIYGDGKQTRDFVYVADVVRANRLAADAALPGFSPFNVGSGRPVSLLDLLAEIARFTGRPGTPIHLSPRAGDIRHSHASLAHAREMLGYVPTVSLEEGLRRTIEYFEKEVLSP